MHPKIFLLIVLGALLAPSYAGAQALPPGWFVSRVGPTGGPAPRAFENLGTVPGPGQATGTAPAVIGIRDCECGEVWNISGPLTSMNGSAQYELWVGTSATACQTAAQRDGVSGTTQSCRRITSGSLGADQNIQPTFNVSIPAAELVNPLNGDCAADDPVLHLGSTTGQLYFAIVYTTPNNDANMTPGFIFAYDYLSPTPAPTSVTASPEEGSALVTWSYAGTSSTTTVVSDGDGGLITVTDDSGTTTDVDGSTTQLQANISYYVLTWPPPPVAPSTFQFDASVCEGSADVAEEDAAVDDSSDGSLPIDDLAPTDASADGEGGVDAGGTDAAVVADASDAGVDAAAAVPVCGAPPTIDPDNDYEFKQLVASSVISAGTGGLTYTVPDLTNGVAYQFAVVVQDSAGNRTMSGWSACVTPQPVTDLWQQYENRGGTASPSYCSVRAPGAVVSWSGGGGALALASATTLLAIRRRRRKKQIGERSPR